MSAENQNSKEIFSEQSPGFIRFFFDPKKPLLLKGFFICLILLIFLYPIFHKKNSVSKKIVQPDTKTEVTPIPDELIHSLASTPIIEDNKLNSLKKIENTFIVPISVLENSKGDIWLNTMQDISFFPNGDIEQQSKKLDSNIYDHLNNNELPAITAATLDANEDLIIGFRDGQIMTYSNYDWKVIFETRDPISDVVKTLASHKNLNFIGSKGLWKWNSANGKLSRYKGFNEENVTTFLQTKSHQLFMATKFSVWQFTEQGWEEFFKIEDSSNAINTLGDFGNNGLLIGTKKGLLLVSGSAILQQTSLLDHNITTIFSENENSFWIGSNLGLKYWENNTWYQLRDVDGLPANNVSLFYQDQKRRAWLGFPGKGAFVIDYQNLVDWAKKSPYQEKVVNKEQTLFYNNACRAVEVELAGQNNSGDIHLENLEGTLSVFMKGNLVCPQGQAFRRADGAVVSYFDSRIILQNVNYPNPPYSPPSGLLKDKEKPKFIYLDLSNRIWLGSTAGITYYQNGDWKNLFSEPDFKENQGNTIIEDKQARIWIGTTPKFNAQLNAYTQAPLHRFDGNSWIHISPNEGLAGWGVNDIIALENSDMAVATNEGISIVKAAEIKPLGNLSELNNKTAFSLNQDSSGLIWLAHLYFGNGINIFDGKNYSAISGPDKLFSENILYINFDAQNRIWLTSSNGKVGIYFRKSFITAEDS